MTINHKINGPINWTALAWITAIITTALAFRFFHLGNKVFWMDEGVTWFIAMGEIHSDFDPVLFYKVAGVFISIFGDSEFAGRLPSAIFGCFSVIFAYLSGRRLLGGEYGVYIGVITAVSAYLVGVSQEMRPYSMVGMEVFAAMYFFLAILKDEKLGIGNWAGLLICSVLGLYTIPIFAFFLLYLGIMLIILRWKDIRLLLIRGGIYSALVIFLYLPQFLNSISKSSGRPHLLETDLVHIKINTGRVLRGLFVFLAGENILDITYYIGYLGQQNSIYYLIAGTALMLFLWVGIAIIIKVKKALEADGFESKFVIGNAGAAVMLAMTFIFIPASTARQLFFIFVPLTFLFTYSLWKLPLKMRCLLLSLYLIMNIYSLTLYYRETVFKYDKINYKEAGLYLRARLQEGDGIFFDSGRNTYYTIRYYAGDITQDVYYRYRETDPDSTKSPYKMKKGDWENSVRKKIIETVEMYPRLWVLKVSTEWEDSEEMKDKYEIVNHNIGTEMTIKLYTHKGKTMESFK